MWRQCGCRCNRFVSCFVTLQQMNYGYDLSQQPELSQLPTVHLDSLPPPQQQPPVFLPPNNDVLVPYQKSQLGRSAVGFILPTQPQPVHQVSLQSTVMMVSSTTSVLSTAAIKPGSNPNAPPFSECTALLCCTAGDRFGYVGW